MYTRVLDNSYDSKRNGFITCVFEMIQNAQVISIFYSAFYLKTYENCIVIFSHILFD